MLLRNKNCRPRELRSLFRATALFLGAALVSWGGHVLAAGCDPLSPDTTYYPQVARGQGSLYLETVVIFSNVGLETGEVRLVASSSQLVPAGLNEFELAPGATRTITLAGPELVAGWLQVCRDPTIVLSVHLITRPSSDSPTLLSQISLLPAQLTSKLAVPVFRTLPGTPGLPQADSSAIALALPQKTGPLLRLLGPTGETIAETQIDSPVVNRHLAFFLEDVFPGLPEDFRWGTLIVEGPEGVPRTLAGTLILTTGTDWRVGQVTTIDVAGEYLLELNQAPTLEEATAIAEQYGFEVVEFFREDTLLILSKDQNAIAASRDPRVASVAPNILIFNQ